MYWTVSLRAGHNSASSIARLAHDRPRPDPSCRRLHRAWSLTAALWASSAVTARGLLDSMTPALARRAALGRGARRCSPRSCGATGPPIVHALAPRRARARGVRARGLRPADLSRSTSALVGTTAINLGPAQLGDPGADRRRSARGCTTGAGRAARARRPRAVARRRRRHRRARRQWATLASLAVNAHDLVDARSAWACGRIYTVRLARRGDRPVVPGVHVRGGLARARDDRCRRSPGTWPTHADGDAVLRGDIAGIVYLGVLPDARRHAAVRATGSAHVGPVQAGLFTHLVPVFAALLATLLLGERLHPFHAVGFALVTGGAILGCLGPTPPRRAPSSRSPPASRRATITPDAARRESPAARHLLRYGLRHGAQPTLPA